MNCLGCVDTARLQLGRSTFRIWIISKRLGHSVPLRKCLPQPLMELIDQLENIQEERVADLKLSDKRPALWVNGLADICSACGQPLGFLHGLPMYCFCPLCRTEVSSSRAVLVPSGPESYSIRRTCVVKGMFLQHTVTLNSSFLRVAPAERPLSTRPWGCPGLCSPSPGPVWGWCVCSV